MLLPEWYPEGKLHGHEFKIGDLHGSEGESLSININTGAWKDFASGDAGGDLISLYAAREGIKQGDAAKALGDEIEVRPMQQSAQPKAPKKPEWTPILPVPDDAPRPGDEYYRKDASGEWTKLKFIARWRYVDAEGKTLGYAVRFEGPGGKDVLPQTYCVSDEGKRQWRWKSFPSPRPLYGLDQLRARPDAPVMLVEGEKKVEALKTLAPQYVGIAWPGGASAWRKADLAPLNTRAICCWPDADKQVITTAAQAEEFGLALGDRIPRDSQPGMRAMWEVGHQLLKHCQVVKVIIPDDETLPDGWDCADALAEGWDWQRLKAWALPRIVQLTEGDTNVRATVRSEERESRAGNAGERASDASRSLASMAESQASGDRERSRSADGPRAATDRSQSGEPARGLEGRSSGARAGDGDERDRARYAGNGATAAGGGARLSQGIHEPNRVELRAGAAHTLTAVRGDGQSQIGRWLAWGLERNGNGLPLTTLSNAVRCLEADEKLRGLIWFDEFLQRIMRRPGAGETSSREWTDADDINLTLYLQREVGLSKIGIDIVSKAIISVARRDIRHCVRDWLHTLKHDGTLRIEEFMTKVFGAKSNRYTRAVSRNFFVSLVARAYEPGCKCDNIVVLEGAQGLYKSSVLLALVGHGYYTEQHESATNAKAFAEILQGKWLVEVSEMDSFSRADTNRVKQVASCQSDRYRDSYGRYASDHPRQCVMAGTVNKDDWNKDETGARRFWPIACKGISDIGYVRAWREQLFAEAKDLYLKPGVACEAKVRIAAGATWWMVPEAEAREEQRKRYDADPWIEPVSFWLGGRNEATVMEIAVTCLRIETRDLDRQRQMRIAGVLRALGWTNDGNKRRGGKVVKVWTAPGDEYPACSDGSDLDQSVSAHERREADSSVATSGQVATEVATRSLLENDPPFQ